MKKKLILFENSEQFDKMSYYELRQRSKQNIKVYLSLNYNKKYIYAGICRKTLNVVGDKIFYKTFQEGNFTIKKGKIYGNDYMHLLTYDELFNELGLDWILKSKYKNFIINQLGASKLLFIKVFSGKITSEKQFLKSVFKIRFKINLSLPIIKKYIYLKTNGYSINLFDYKSFTDSVEKSINILYDKHINRTISEMDIFYQIVEYMFIRGKKINFSWSKKRLINERLKATKEDISIKFKDGKEKDEIIYNSIPQFEFNVINTKKELFTQLSKLISKGGYNINYLYNNVLSGESLLIKYDNYLLVINRNISTIDYEFIYSYETGLIVSDWGDIKNNNFPEKIKEKNFIVKNEIELKKLLDERRKLNENKVIDPIDSKKSPIPF